jgi:hypothetical protein
LISRPRPIRVIVLASRRFYRPKQMVNVDVSPGNINRRALDSSGAICVSSCGKRTEPRRVGKRNSPSARNRADILAFLTLIFPNLRAPQLE